MQQIHIDLKAEIKQLNDNIYRRTRGQRFLSPSKIYDYLTPPKDWYKIAERTSKKYFDDPTSKYYQMSPEQVQQSWWSKSDAGANRGNILDDYIAHTLHKKPFDISKYDVDVIAANKLVTFKKMYEKEFYNNSIVPFMNEMWTVSERLGVRGRLDELFLYSDKLLLVDWKNTETITDHDQFRNGNMLGPASHIEQCDWAKFTLQTQIYRHIINTEYPMNVSATRVVQIKEHDYKFWKPMFNYDPDFIEACIKFAKEEKARRDS